MTESQNRDLWFTLPPQQPLLVLWLFSAIPIPILKFPIFYSSSIIHMQMFPTLQITKDTVKCYFPSQSINLQ